MRPYEGGEIILIFSQNLARNPPSLNDAMVDVAMDFTGLGLLLQEAEGMRKHAGQIVEKVTKILTVLEQNGATPPPEDLAREESDFEDLARETPPRLLRRLLFAEREQHQHNAMRIGVVDTLSKAAARAKAKAEAPAKMARRWREITRVRVRAREEEEAAEAMANAEAREAEANAEIAELEANAKSLKTKLAVNLCEAKRKKDLAIFDKETATKRAKNVCEAVVHMSKQQKTMQNRITDCLKNLKDDSVIKKAYYKGDSVLFTRPQSKIADEFWEQNGAAAKKAFFGDVGNGPLKGWFMHTGDSSDWIGHLNVSLWEAWNLAYGHYTDKKIKAPFKPHQPGHDGPEFNEWNNNTEQLDKQLLLMFGCVVWLDEHGNENKKYRCSHASKDTKHVKCCGDLTEGKFWACSRCARYLVKFCQRCDEEAQERRRNA